MECNADLAYVVARCDVRYSTIINQREYIVEVRDQNQVMVDGKCYQVDFDSLSTQPIHSMLINNDSYEAFVFPGEKSAIQVLLRGRLYTAHVEEEHEKRSPFSTGNHISVNGEYQLKAPMPGMVIAIPCCEGDEVERGDILLILESMKMQNELRAPRAGKIARLRVKPGDSVEQMQPLLTIV